MAIAHEGPKISDRALRRLVIWTAIGLAVLLAAFSVVYYLGQRPDTAPSLVDRKISAAEDAVKAAPQNVQVRLQLATAYQAANRLDDAIAQYDEILRAVPGSTAALLGEGNAKLTAGDLDGAKALFAKITKAGGKTEFSAADPQLEAAHYWLASIAMRQSATDVALKEVNAALAIDSSDADALYLLGTIQSQKGDDKAAVATFTQAVAFVPTGWCDPYQAMSTSYSKLNQAPQAEYAGAMLDFCNNKPDSASKRLEALTSGPVALDALLGLGLVAETTSDRTAAVDWYQKALKASPTNAAAVSALARLGATPTSASSASPTTSAQTKAS